jgi:hypothetical protein
MFRIREVTAAAGADGEMRSAASQLDAAIAGIDAYVKREDFSGYDPYDALMSPIFQLPLLRSSHWVRLAAQQVLKRFPLNVRPLLGIRKHASPVTFARMLEGYAYLFAIRPERGDHYSRQIKLCLERIDGLRSSGYSGDCWGYELDWEPRHAESPIPAGTPNIVATGIVTNALFETYRLTGDHAARDSCANATPFLLRDLERTTAADGAFCWGYFPGDRQLVLNATMKGARLCAQVFSLTGNASLRDQAEKTVRFVVGQQRPDGAWPYAVGDPRSWVDNFHTGYVLDCLDAYEQHTGDQTFSSAKERGWHYYRTHFLTKEYAPKHFDLGVYPIDATACAQAITTLCTFGDLSAAGRAALWTLANMRRSDGGFIYQRHAHYANRISYMRWSVAPMYSAVARLLYALESPVSRPSTASGGEES